ncbi:MAG: Pleiotropic drug resistance protein 1, antibiotic transport system permease protein [Chloroflexi bacterium CSP1-4]|nr:MAG: Pleiotropic drug resistance protein 1, antibiotic transport system permease protein [Chloroflexi bacterium CSP1-4]
MLAFARETWYLGLRTLRRFLRVPANPISTVIFPLIQLVGFSQLFRDIIQLPGFAGQTSYLAYLAPGQIAFTVFLAVSWSGSNLLYDYRNGYLDKLRAAPIRRYSILAGELVPLGLECAAMAGVILLVSVALGASVATGFVGAVLILVLCAAFGVAWSGTSFLPALLTKNEQATGTLSILFFPLAFMSTAFVPVRLMPDWLQVLNAVNPISYVIEAARALMTTGYDWGAIGAAVVAIVAVGVVLQGATLLAFRRLTN